MKLLKKFIATMIAALIAVILFSGAEAQAAHTHKYSDTRTVAATCTKDGQEYGICSCGARKTLKTIPALGHNYKAVETVKRTCTQDGWTRYTCQRKGCNSTYTSITHFN